MTLDPERQFDAFVKAGCGRIIFHAEATRHSHRLVQDLKSRGVRAGVAINPGTSVDAIASIIHDIDLALVMTVNPGWGGQSFISSTLDKIRQVRSLSADLDIQVDGGIDLATTAAVVEAGATVLVAGSAIFGAVDPKGAAAALRAKAL